MPRGTFGSRRNVSGCGDSRRYRDRVRDLTPAELAAVKMTEPDRSHTLRGRRVENDPMVHTIHIDPAETNPYTVNGKVHRTLRSAASAARRP